MKCMKLLSLLVLVTGMTYAGEFERSFTNIKQYIIGIDRNARDYSNELWDELKEFLQPRFDTADKLLQAREEGKLAHAYMQFITLKKAQVLSANLKKLRDKLKQLNPMLAEEAARRRKLEATKGELSEYEQLEEWLRSSEREQGRIRELFLAEYPGYPPTEKNLATFAQEIAQREEAEFQRTFEEKPFTKKYKKQLERAKQAEAEAAQRNKELADALEKAKAQQEAAQDPAQKAQLENIVQKLEAQKEVADDDLQEKGRQAAEIADVLREFAIRQPGLEEVRYLGDNISQISMKNAYNKLYTGYQNFEQIMAPIEDGITKNFDQASLAGIIAAIGKGSFKFGAVIQEMKDALKTISKLKPNEKLTDKQGVNALRNIVNAINHNLGVYSNFFEEHKSDSEEYATLKKQIGQYFGNYMQSHKGGATDQSVGAWLYEAHQKINQ